MGSHAYTYPTVIELRRAGLRTDARELGGKAPQRLPSRALPAQSRAQPQARSEWRTVMGGR
jgi:hypothetical protein